MLEVFERHRALLDTAVEALTTRRFWSPFPEVPSGKIYGEDAKTDGQTAFEALIGQPFPLAGHPRSRWLGDEVSPWTGPLLITYPSTGVGDLIAASEAVADAWADAEPTVRIGVCLEVIVRLNRMSFLMAHAVMQTTGQAFPMAFQAGGPHAQDRALEAVAMAWTEMTRFAGSAVWEKPQGKATPIVLEKHWKVVPRGVAVAIGCQTFPKWNTYPGLFASLATGNPVIVKPHPGAILPIALTVRVIREVLAEAGFPPNVALLAVDERGAEVSKELVTHPSVAIVDYTGSGEFGAWLRDNGAEKRLFTEESGINTVSIVATEDFDGMCANLAFSLSLYSGQMCTAPQNIYVPMDGIETDLGHRSVDEVAAGIARAIDDLLADPDRAAGICGAVANRETFKRIDAARPLGRVVRDSASIAGGRGATPLLIAVGADDVEAYEAERFGPIAFVVAVADAADAVSRAASLAKRKGAITAALYDTDEDRIAASAKVFARAGANLSVNLTGNIYVNQSAAFSDFHVSGANPAGTASLTDPTFVADRFNLAMWRRPLRA